ncbi:MAG TPA: tetratricopeptide repeat protein, partial [Polyangiales bacterium]
PLHVTVRETGIERVTSLLGQPVYLAGYLVMVAPITAQRTLEARRTRALWVYAPLLSLQLVTIVLTESRGALLAFVTGGAFALLVYAARSGSRRVVLGLWSLAAAAALAIAIYSPSHAATESISKRRAEDTFSVHGSGGEFRDANWRVAVRLLANHEPAEFADGRHDAHAWLRPIVGYGPDVLHAVTPPFFDDELVRNLGYFVVWHLHNDLWDALLETGLLGLTAALALQLMLLRMLLRKLALDSSPLAFYGSATAGAISGGVGWSLLHGPGFFFLGLQLGLLFGLALSVSARAWQPRVQGSAVPLELALLAGSVAHLIETSFSFTVVATGLVFWVGAGLASATVQPSQEPPRSAFVDVAMLSWVTFALGFGFLGASTLSPNSSTVLRDGLVLTEGGARVPVVAVMLLVSLIWGAALLRVEGGGRGWAVRLGVAVVLAWAFWGWHAALLAKLAVTRDALAALELRTSAIDGFYLATFAILLALAFGLTPRPPAPSIVTRPALRAVAIALVLALATTAMFPLAVRPAQAEAAVGLANARRDKNQFDQAELLYRKASELWSGTGAYPALLAKSLVKRARAEDARGTNALKQAELAIGAAIASDPVDGENVVNQALILSQLLAHGGERDRELRGRTAQSYARALRLHPFDPALRRAHAVTELTSLHDITAALASARRAVELEPARALNHATLGDALLATARDQRGAPREATLREAALSYEQASRLDPGQAAFRLGAGRAYLAAGQTKKGIEVLRSTLASLPASARERPATIALLRRAESVTPAE